jgi:predicted dienelactone hydrolase
MFRSMILAFTVACVWGGTQALAQTVPAVGLRTFSFLSPARGHSVESSLWYPSAANTDRQRIGDSQVFTGVSAHPNAAMAAGRHPLVLLAHGGLRSARFGSAWIAADLAARGYIVLQVHPPALAPDEAHRAGPEIWLRPADLSAALTAIESDADIRAHVAPGFVGVLGFLRGATTALALAGARFDAEKVQGACDAMTTVPGCGWLRASGVDLHQLPADQIEADYRDPRVRVVVAVAPDLQDAVNAASVQRIGIPVHIVQLGSAVVRVAGPQVSSTQVPDAHAMSVFNLCTPSARATLLAEGEDPALCADGGGRPRSAIHADLAVRIADLMWQAGGTPPR